MPYCARQAEPPFVSPSTQAGGFGSPVVECAENDNPSFHWQSAGGAVPRRATFNANPTLWNLGAFSGLAVNAPSTEYLPGPSPIQELGFRLHDQDLQNQQWVPPCTLTGPPPLPLTSIQVGMGAHLPGAMGWPARTYSPQPAQAPVTQPSLPWLPSTVSGSMSSASTTTLGCSMGALGL